jgi:hypothetical protein
MRIDRGALALVINVQVIRAKDPNVSAESVVRRSDSVRIVPGDLPAGFVEVPLDVHDRLDGDVEQVGRAVRIGVGEVRKLPVFAESSTTSTIRPRSTQRSCVDGLQACEGVAGGPFLFGRPDRE